MKPYSNDLRERVISAVDHHEGTLSHIARRFQVSLKTVRRWLQRRRQTGSLDPTPHGGGRHRAVDGQDAERLKQLVRERPDATLDEMNTSLGLDCSRMAIARALVRLGISRKKKSLHASERDTPKVKRKRRDFRRKLAQVDPKHLVFVDETGAHTAMTRFYGRAPRGVRVVGSVPGHWESVTLVTAVRLAGVSSPIAFPGAMDTPTFESYVEQISVPELGPDDVVVWDNLRRIRAARRGGRSGKPRRGWCSYPHTAQTWPDREDVLEDQGGSAVDRGTDSTTVYEAMDRALKSVHKEDMIGWFRFCGLCPTQS